MSTVTIQTLSVALSVNLENVPEQALEINADVYRQADNVGRTVMVILAGVDPQQAARVVQELNKLFTLPATAETPTSGYLDRTTIRGRQRKLRTTADKIVWDPTAIDQFSFMFETYGQEAARLDRFVIGHLNRGAAGRIRDSWMLTVADRYRNNKPTATPVQIPANPKLGISEFFLEIMPEDARVQYWMENYDALVATGLFSLIEQLAYYWRAKGKSNALASIGTNVTATLSDARYDPETIEDLMQRALAKITQFMQDRTRSLRATRIAQEHHVAVLNILEDEDFLTFVANPPRDIQDIYQYFWTSGAVDVELERQAIDFGTLVGLVFQAMTQYREGVNFAEWMMQPSVVVDEETQEKACLADLANQLFVLTEKMGANAPKRYSVEPSREPGIMGAMKNLFLSIKARVSVTVGNTTVELEVKSELDLSEFDFKTEVENVNHMIMLRTAFASLYPDQTSQRRVVNDAKLNERMIQFDSKATNSWHYILVETKRQNKVAELCTVILRENPEDKTLWRTMYQVFSK